MAMYSDVSNPLAARSKGAKLASYRRDTLVSPLADILASPLSDSSTRVGGSAASFIEEYDEMGTRDYSGSELKRRKDDSNGKSTSPEDGIDNAAHQPPKRKRMWWLKWWCTRPLGFAASLLILLLIANVLLEHSQLRGDDGEDFVGKHGSSGHGSKGQAWYATDFLGEVDPIPCHSHNDYWRKVPLFSATRAGCIGVEADIWLKDGDLYVGHGKESLRPSRTLRSLYINPLLHMLGRQNPANRSNAGTWNGVFGRKPNQTLTLLVDMKSDGMSTWPVLMKQLQPLRDKGWLSFFQNGTVNMRPLIVVGTGDTPYSMVMANSTYRDSFFDAPLDKLEGSEYNSLNSYYASVSFKKTFGSFFFGGPSGTKIDKLKKQIKLAHKEGLKVRYWGTPAWPRHVRNRIWTILVQEGVDLLNVDDLRGAVKVDWTKTTWPLCPFC